MNDFLQEGDEATIRFHLEGGRIKVKGIAYRAAEAIQEYIDKAGIRSGPLFRPRTSSKGENLAERRMTERSMNRLLMAYLERLPGSMQEVELPNGEKVTHCLYSPLSIRVTTATLSRHGSSDRVCPRIAGPQAHHDNADLRQTAPLGTGFGITQGPGVTSRTPLGITDLSLEFQPVEHLSTRLKVSDTQRWRHAPISF